MSLKLIYGRSGSGKSHYCIEEMRRKLERGDKHLLLLLVPEQFSYQAEKNLMDAIGTTGIRNVQVLSFQRMAYTVFNEVGGITAPHLDGAGKAMLLYKVMEELKEEFQVFATAARQRGFIQKVLDSLMELKQYNVTPEILGEMKNQVPEGELLYQKLTDMHRIYDTFERKIHTQYIDPEDDLTLLYEKLEQSTLFNGAEIWMDEFTGFTPQQYNIIEKLFRKAKRVHITLTLEPEVGREFEEIEVFAPLRATENKLLALAEKQQISLEKFVVLRKKPYYRFQESEELGYLEANYDAFPYTPYSAVPRNIQIFKAVNPYSEVEDTAKDILRLCREEGLRFHEIAVVTRDLKAYEKIVKAVFTEYDIPFFIDRKKDITTNPLIVLLTAALEIFVRNWSYEAMFRYLKTGLLAIDQEQLDALENHVLATGVKGKKKWVEEGEWNSQVQYLYGHQEMTEERALQIEKLRATRIKIITPLLDFHEKVKGRRRVTELCMAVYNFLCEIQVPERIEAWIESFKAQGKQELANEYSQIWNLIMSLLDQMVEVLGEEKVNLEEFIKILSIGFQQHQMGLIPPALDQVLVGSVERIKSHDIHVLYVLGVNDGVFPRANKEEGLFTDLDRMMLKEKGLELALDTRTQAFHEQFLIYSTLTLPGKYLRLSYPIADYEGKTLRPSIIISKVKALYPKLIEKNNIVEITKEEKECEGVCSPIPTFNELVAIMRKEKQWENLSPLWKSVCRWYLGKEEWREKTKAIFSGFAYRNQMALLEQEKTQKLYGEKKYFSASRIERYVSCPFAYFVQYGLEAKERPTFQFSAPDLGTFMHEVLDGFSKVVQKEGRLWRDLEKPWCEAQVATIVEGKLSETPGFVLNSSPRYQYFTKRMKRILFRAIWMLVEHMKRSGFEPMGYEMSFSPTKEGDYPPIEIELSTGEKVYLIGRIDRVDKLEGEGEIYYRIVDYKSGKKDFSLSEVYYGLQVQLLLYLDAILTHESTKGEGATFPAGMLYFKIDDPVIKADRTMSEEDIEKAIMKALKMKGLLLADPAIIREMDREIEGSSLIIPANLKKDGNLGSASSVATKEQFQALRKHVKEEVAKACESMLRGEISIRPYKKKGNTPCTYCLYKSVCQFDPTLEENSYKIITEKKDKEVWKMLENAMTQEAEE